MGTEGLGGTDLAEFRINALNFRLPWQSIRAPNARERSQGLKQADGRQTIYFRVACAGWTAGRGRWPPALEADSGIQRPVRGRALPTATFVSQAGLPYMRLFFQLTATQSWETSHTLPAKVRWPHPLFCRCLSLPVSMGTPWAGGGQGRGVSVCQRGPLTQRL